MAQVSGLGVWPGGCGLEVWPGVWPGVGPGGGDLVGGDLQVGVGKASTAV